MMVGTTFGISAQDTGSEQEPTFYLQVVNVDGTEVYVPFADMPVITREENSLVLVSESLDLEYPDGTLDYFTVTTEKPESGVGAVKADLQKVGYRISGNSLLLTKGRAGSPVVIASADGKVIASANFDAQGNALLTLPDSTDIYIIKADQTNFKLIKK